MTTNAEILAIAIQHHQAGRLEAAEQMYRQILLADPDHADAIHLLGLIAHQNGNHEAAVDLIVRSIQLDGTAANVHNNLGGVYRAMGRISEAVACYRRAVELKPSYADGYINLAMTLADQGNRDEAITCYRKAIELKPNVVSAYLNLADTLAGLKRFDEALACYLQIVELQPQDVQTRINIGNLLANQGKPGEAIACYREAIELKPDFAIAHMNLGVALKSQGKTNEAINCYRRALELNPDFSEAFNNLGNALEGQGQLDQAIAYYQRALELKPDAADPCNNLGNVLYEQGKLDEAIPHYRRALQLQPNFAKAHSNLGVVLQALGKHDDAIACYRQALEIIPNYAEAHSYLGSALKSRGKLDEAMAHCQRAVELKPNDAETLNHLGNVLKDQGKLDDAIDCYRRAIQLQPDHDNVHSNLVYTQIFCPGYDGQAILEEHRRWNRFHAEPLARFIQPHPNDHSTDRRLRIGYVSPDFRNHVVGRNLLPLFRKHDHRQFEIFCYSGVPHDDEMTSRFQDCADHWRKTTGLTDEQLCQCIRDDGIDILVDLTLHMALNRLLVFARKPAPVQVTFAGYPGTTGLSTIDYRLTDPYLDPPGLYDHLYTEQSIRLVDSFWCYDPLDNEVNVNALPVAERGHVTFGCLNNFCKVNHPTLKMWAQVLKTVKDSRLMILAGEGTHRQHTLDVLATEGVEDHRVTFVPNQTRKHYLNAYHNIDVALDTVPYNGHTTTLDSFWMGVPVVTAVGPTVVGRAGLSQLMNLGLPELIANSPEQFVDIAVDLAGNLARMADLRATLRQRMQASVLMDQPQFAQSIEAAYREMWRRWCHQ